MDSSLLWFDTTILFGSIFTVFLRPCLLLARLAHHLALERENALSDIVLGLKPTMLLLKCIVGSTVEGLKWKCMEFQLLVL